MLIDLAILTNQAIMTHKITKALVRDILWEVIVANPQVLTPGMEDGGALKCLSPNPLERLRI